MVKFADRARGPEKEEMPKMCGINGCGEKCDVIIGYKNIARCSRHYQKDIDTYRGERHSATSFVFEKGMPRL